MYKLLGVCTLFIVGLVRSTDIPLEPFPTLDSAYPLQWKTKTGVASFRTNVVFIGDRILMGSNGMRFRDYWFTDEGSGVNLLSRKDGKRLKQFAHDPFGDMDVNGILVKGNRMYFGNDNEEFQCMSLDGKLIWRLPVSGDVEHEPLELNINGKPCIVFATESGEVRAIDSENGKTVWAYYIPEFRGWKAGDNRTVFKVGAFFTNTFSFYSKPAVVDLNNDHVPDLVYPSYSSDIYAINGKTGKLLWKVEEGKRHSQPMIAVQYINGNPQLKYFEYEWIESEMHSYLTTLDRFGKRLRSERFFSTQYSEGLNSLTIDHKLIITTSDTMMIFQDGKPTVKIDRQIPYKYINYKNDTVTSIRNSYDPLIGTKAFNLEGFGKCIVVLNQRDASSEKGFIEFISLDQQKVVQRFALPCLSEMPPIIEDINQDGYIDMLLNGYDGYTYCYRLQLKK